MATGKSTSCEDCPIFRAVQEEMLERYNSPFDAAIEMNRWECPAKKGEKRNEKIHS